MRIVIIVKKQDICMDLDMVNVMNENYKSMFHNGAKFDFRLIIEYVASK